MDDGMIDELMITNTEHLGDMNDMNFNKSSNVIKTVGFQYLSF